MKPLSLLNRQRIKICDHKWDGRSIHDFSDPSAAIHLDKEPNYGLDFHGKIRIPLKGDVSFDVPEAINRNLDRKQIKEIKERLTEEIKNAFSDENADGVTKENFIYQIVDILCHDWRDKLSSEKRAIDVATRLAKAFDLGDEVKHIIKMQEKKISEYHSTYTSRGKRYYVNIQPDLIELGENTSTTTKN